MTVTSLRLTQYASGGGCACKIPPGELEDVVRGLTGDRDPDLVVGLDDGDDAAVVRVGDHLAVVATADFFTPVVDDAYDWGRIAAGERAVRRLRDGRRPVVAVNLVGWPRSLLPVELLGECCAGSGRGAAGGLPRRRRPQHRRPGAQVRDGGHGWSTPTGCSATTPPRRACPCR